MISDGNIAELVSDNDGDIDCATCVGSIVISKMTDIMEWKVKCLKKRPTSRSFYGEIGILPADYDVVDEEFDGICDFGYGLFIANGNTAHCSKQIGHHDELANVQENDILTVKYVSVLEEDVEDRGELYFGVNDKPLIKVFDNVRISNDEKYRFGVSLYCIGETVQIV